MDKLPVKEQASRRSELYMIALGAIQQEGLATEVVSNGAIIHCEDGQHYRLKIQYCNPEKFSIDKEREAYQEKLSNAAERARKAAEKKKKEEEERLREEKVRQPFSIHYFSSRFVSSG